MVDLNCKYCNRLFQVKPYRKSIAKYCSHKCYSIDKLGKSPWNMGLKTGFVPKTAFKKGEHVSSKTEFKKGQIVPHLGHVAWNKGMKFIKISGSAHWAWKGGISSTNSKIRNSLEYNQWRTSVFKRDSYICQICGQWGGKLNAHHIKPFAYFPELRFDVENGQTLCLNCHKLKGTYKGRNYLYV